MLKSNGATRNRRIQQMIQHFINIGKLVPIKVTSDCLFQNSGLRIIQFSKVYIQYDPASAHFKYSVVYDLNFHT